MTRPGSAPLVLLATATIDPRGAALTARSDPTVRRADYQRALTAWLAATAVPVVFCENSGSDLRPLQRAVPAGRVDWLSFDASPYPPEKGKSYGEALIIRHAIEHSARIADATTVVKVTGRLFVRNAARILAGLSSARFDVASELRLGALEWSDSRLVAASPAFLTDYLLPECERIDERRPITGTMEGALARAVLRRVADGGTWMPLPRCPVFEGYSGTVGTRISNRRYPLQVLARAARGAARRLAV